MLGISAEKYLKIFNGFQFIKDKEMIEFLDFVGGPCGSVCRLLEAKNEKLNTFTTDKERSHILVVEYYSK